MTSNRSPPGSPASMHQYSPRRLSSGITKHVGGPRSRPSECLRTVLQIEKKEETFSQVPLLAATGHMIPGLSHEAKLEQAIKTRFLILSDTHAEPFDLTSNPSIQADVAIHCGDLTEESQLDEFYAAIKLLQSIDAPLKLVIAGNHDITLDPAAFTRTISESAIARDEPALVEKVYGRLGQARELFTTANSGIIFLEEGTHRFELSNGARLTVYASPYTPSQDFSGAYRFHPSGEMEEGSGVGHEFAIPGGVDVVVTHGPPHGVLDVASGTRTRAGGAELFTAVAHSRPLMHCFGHIHEGWGAKLVRWRDDRVSRTSQAPTEQHLPNHFTAIDHSKSVVVETLASLRAGKWDSAEAVADKASRLAQYRAAKCLATSHCADDKNPIHPNQHTLFVNAAIQAEEEGYDLQLPWLVDLELPCSRGCT